ncbi:replication initiator protein A [Deinococcus sonorensis]|uniref:Replication initiator protein A n=2 Tax=Deinococcus sonorensis TaxID=309891 RepID=A0AAU7U5D4_9DEIO
MTESLPKRFDEINVSQLSLISVQERIPEDFRDWTVEHEDATRRYRVSCQALPEYGVPHGIDNDVTTALINLLIEQGLPESNVVTATPYLILQTAGLDTSGRYYANLDQSLKRLLTTNYMISEGWRDHPRRRWTTASFRYIEKLEFTSTVDSTALEPGSVLKITLPQELVRSVRAGYIKVLDLAFMQSLKRPPTRALYRLLDARRHDPEEPQQRVLSYQLNLMEWGRACKIVSDRPSLIERALNSAHEELIERGYLLEVNIFGRGQKKTIEYVFNQLQAVPDPQLVEDVMLTGITRIRAQQLIAQHGQDRIERALEQYETLLRSGYKPRNRAALLVDVLNNPQKYSAPAIEAPAPAARPAERVKPAPAADPHEAFERTWQQMSREDQVEEVMRVVGVMLRGELTLQELDALRQVLQVEDPLAIRREVLAGVTSHRRDEVVRQLRLRLSSLG